MVWDSSSTGLEFHETPSTHAPTHPRTHACTCTHALTHACTHPHTHTCMRTRTTHTCTHMRTRMHAHTHPTHVHTPTHVRAHVHTAPHTHACTHVHTPTHTMLPSHFSMNIRAPDPDTCPKQSGLKSTVPAPALGPALCAPGRHQLPLSTTSICLAPAGKKDTYLLMGRRHLSRNSQVVRGEMGDTWDSALGRGSGSSLQDAAVTVPRRRAGLQARRDVPLAPLLEPPAPRLPPVTGLAPRAPTHGRAVASRGLAPPPSASHGARSPVPTAGRSLCRRRRCLLAAPRRSCPW